MNGNQPSRSAMTFLPTGAGCVPRRSAGTPPRLSRYPSRWNPARTYATLQRPRRASPFHKAAGREGEVDDQDPSCVPSRRPAAGGGVRSFQCVRPGAPQSLRRPFPAGHVRALGLPGTTATRLYRGGGVRNQAHVRAQHGTSCYRVGRCRLPNSYLYDPEIVPRVSRPSAWTAASTTRSVWVLGEPAHRHPHGLRADPEQAQQLEQAVLLVDDVMGVVNFLMLEKKEGPVYGPPVMLPLHQ